MARIRSIKPEFPQSETIGRLSRDARLLFVQLWTIVDDEGRARAASRMLASLLYPYDDDAKDLISSWLDELETAECLVRYEVDGSTYLQICNWLKHQKIDRPSSSKLPPFDEGSRVVANPREPSRALDADLGPRKGSRIKDLGSSSLRSDETRARRASDFDQFWAKWPHKVQRKDAAKAFAKCKADLSVLLAGVDRYVRDKPPDRPWLNPATWLNRECWLDEPAPPPAATARGSPREDGLTLARQALQRRQAQNEQLSGGIFDRSPTAGLGGNGAPHEDLPEPGGAQPIGGILDLPLTGPGRFG